MEVISRLSSAVAACVLLLAACKESTPGSQLAPDGMPVADRSATLAIMRRVADYELTRFGTDQSRNWQRAVFYTGLMALYRADNDAKYLTAARTWGKSNNWQLETDTGDSTAADPALRRQAGLHPDLRRALHAGAGRTERSAAR